MAKKSKRPPLPADEERDVLTEEQIAFIHSLADDQGRIDPQKLKQAAKDPDCCLHGHPWWKNWDAHEAAESHWLDVAKRFIKFVKLEVVITRNTIVSPYYVVDPNRESRKTTYIALNRAAHDENLSYQILEQDIEQSLMRFRRTERIAAVLGLTAQIRAIVVALKRFENAFRKARDRRVRVLMRDAPTRRPRGRGGKAARTRGGKGKGARSRVRA